MMLCPREEMLTWVGGKRPRHPPVYRGALFTEIRRLGLERLVCDVVEALPANLRVRSALLRAGDLECLTALAEVDGAIEAEIRLDELYWESGELVLRTTGWLRYGDGTPLAFEREDAKVYWSPPVDLGLHVRLEDRDVKSDLEKGRIELYVRSREDRAEFFLPVESSIVWDEQDNSLSVSFRAEARLDPLSCAAGRSLGQETWDVVARVYTGDWASTVRVGVNRSESLPPLLPAALLGDPAHVVIPFWTEAGNLSVDIDQFSKTLGGRIRPSQADVRSDTSAVAFALALPALLDSRASATPVELQAKRSGPAARAVVVPARLCPSGADGSFARLEARFPFRKTLPTKRSISPGSWKLSAKIGRSTKSLGLVLDIGNDGAPSVRSTRSNNGAASVAEVAPGLAERVRFDPSWRRHIPRPIRFVVRTVRHTAHGLAVSSLSRRGRMN